MHPVLFYIPGTNFPIRTFGALVACGILLAMWLWGRLLARYGDDPQEDPQRGSQIALWIVIGVLGGARLMYVAVESMRYLTSDVTPAMHKYLDAPDRGTAGMELAAADAKALDAAREISVGYDFLHDPLKMLFVWQGGLVMYGGLFGGVLLGLFASRKYGLDPWNALDTALVCGFFGLVLGRCGCLMVGDDYGLPVPPQWEQSARPIVLANGGEIGALTIQVPNADWLSHNSESLFEHDLAGKVLWATQPWMSLNALLIACTGWFWLAHRRQRGVPAALMLMQYAVCRFGIEMFRGDKVRGIWFGGISTSQIVSVILFGAAIVLFVKRRASAAPSRT